MKIRSFPRDHPARARVVLPDGCFVIRPAAIRARYCVSQNQPRPIFIVGAPRTGTTLVREILTLHPDVHIYDEVHFCERVLDRYGPRPTLSPRAAARAARTLLRETRWCGAGDDPHASVQALLEAAGPPPLTYAGLLQGYLETEAAHHGAHIWGDSSPQDVLYLDSLKEWFPSARVIILARDPRAYLASYKNYVRKGLSSYHNRYNPFLNAYLWRRYMNSALAAESRPWSSDVHRVHYETLVSQPEATVAAICRFLELEFRPEMLSVSRQNSSYFAVQRDYQASGISDQSLGRWRKTLSPAEQWVIERIASDPMRTLGYRPEAGRLPPTQWPALIAMSLRLPFRLFNLLFRAHKPFTLAKLRKVLTRRGT
jgi:hypothetical protein